MNTRDLYQLIPGPFKGTSYNKQLKTIDQQLFVSGSEV
jgi:hypothetical protein